VLAGPPAVRPPTPGGRADQRVMVFPTIRGETGEGPVFADLPDLDLDLSNTTVIDEGLVLLDYRVADRPGDGGDDRSDSASQGRPA
jgi:hypothetical protein